MYNYAYNLGTMIKFIIVMGMVMVWLFGIFAKRDSEGWDKTFERKGMKITRIVLMCIWGISVIAPLVALIFGWDKVRDNQKVSYVSYIMFGVALFYYELTFRQSPRSIWVKIRKVFAYILIGGLYIAVLPTTILQFTTGRLTGVYGNAIGTILIGNTIIYGIAILIIWLLLKRYKGDKYIPYIKKEIEKSVETSELQPTEKNIQQNEVLQNNDKHDKQLLSDNSPKHVDSIAYKEDVQDVKKKIHFNKKTWKWILGGITLIAIAFGGIKLYNYLHDEYIPMKKLDKAVDEIVIKFKAEETRKEYAVNIVLGSQYNWGYSNIKYKSKGGVYRNGNVYVWCKLEPYMAEASRYLSANTVDEIVRKSRLKDTGAEYSYYILKKDSFGNIPDKPFDFRLYDNRHIRDYIDDELKKYCSEAFSRIESMAFAGDAKCQYYLGCIYSNQSKYKNYDGCPYYEKSRDNWKKAAYWLQEAAKNGYKEAFTMIGICYKEGRGVAVDDVKAYKWLKKGAETGDVYAQLACGDILRKYGHIDQAKYWWKKAAAQGNEKAKERLQKIYN